MNNLKYLRRWYRSLNTMFAVPSTGETCDKNHAVIQVAERTSDGVHVFQLSYNPIQLYVGDN